ncbi:unnamed protein product [Calicophoron daubneyi]|uniref:phospholipase A2 n=1 Tax=Calicophoron daubneyi TaxID=300641 RepID=A0AAV2T6N0_CALDB
MASNTYLNVSSLGKYVSNFVKTALSSISPNKVVAYTQSQYDTEYQDCELLYHQEPLFFFYKVANHFEMVYVPRKGESVNGEEVPFAYSLFRFQGTEEAGAAAFARHIEVLEPLHSSSGSLNLPFDRVQIEKAAALCREQLGWTAAHIAAAASWPEVFQSSAVRDMLNRYDPASGMTPLRIAIEAEDTGLMEHFLSLSDIELGGVNEDGETILHLAAKHCSAKMLSLLLPRLGDEVDVNALTNAGDSALLLACVKPSKECIELLLNAGANPLVGAAALPLQCVVRADSMECVDLITSHCPNAVNCQEQNDLDYPIHCAANSKMVRHLIELGADLDVANASGETMLHKKVRENDLEEVLYLLSRGADPNVGDSEGSHPLHYAVKFGACIHIIRALIVFEADPSALDNRNQTPRHILCVGPTDYALSASKDLALYTMHAVGASRCPPNLEDCTAGCINLESARRKHIAVFDGTAPEVVHNMNEDFSSLFEEIFSAGAQVTAQWSHRRRHTRCGSYGQATEKGLSDKEFNDDASSVSRTNAILDSPLPSNQTLLNSSSGLNRRYSYQSFSHLRSSQHSGSRTSQLNLASDPEEYHMQYVNGDRFSERMNSKRPSRMSEPYRCPLSPLHFFSRDCCCDEEYLHYRYDIANDGSEPQASQRERNDIPDGPEALADRQSRWSVSSSSSSFSTDDYGLSKRTYSPNPKGEQFQGSDGLFSLSADKDEPPTFAVHSESVPTTEKSTKHESDKGFSCGPRGYRVISLDGGGIRGLVLVQALRALERVTGKRVTELFDWIIGTSTGGILGLMITRGKCLRCCRGLLFSFKDTVFAGKRPYSADGFESILRREFGENTLMTDLKKIRVAVTTVVCDRCPPILHLFRNYPSPRLRLHDLMKSLHSDDLDHHRRLSDIAEQTNTEDESGKASLVSVPSSVLNFIMGASGFLTRNGSLSPVPPPDAECGIKFDPVPPDSEQLVWKAARATGAAPTYFRPCGRFLDGGLMSNNPTLDLLTELQEMQMARQLKGKATIPLAVVVSLGTGRMPVEAVQSVDVFRPQSLMETFQSALGISSLGRIVVEVATLTEGAVVDRAAAWCASLGVPFFRMSPRISLHIPLNTVDTKELLQLVWETEVYLYNIRDRIQQLGAILSQE